MNPQNNQKHTEIQRTDTSTKTTHNNLHAEVYYRKAGIHKQAQQSSLLALTIFQCSIASLLTKALLITVQ
jgi:hypothetical protein